MAVALCLGSALTASATQASAGATGDSNGNHDLGCRVIVPAADKPAGGLPVIVWADGWYQGEINGAETTAGYADGLRGWADEGWFIVAATQWSARSTDVLRCVTWAFSDDGYAGDLDATKIGLAGHSQGGGAVLKAADGEPTGKANGPSLAIGSFEIRAVVAMNPYGPSYPDLSQIDGPALFLGGSNDTTTPTSSFESAWQSVRLGPGGILAELEGGTHNSEAWGNPPIGTDFGRFQDISEQWWRAMFDDGLTDEAAIQQVMDGVTGQSGWSRLESSLSE